MTDLERQEIIKIALLASCASVLHLLESFIPYPIPGLKLGLANIITLIAMITMGFNAGIYVVLLRVIIGSVFAGSLFSPGFILSFSGSLMSAFAMGFVLFVINRKKIIFSIVGISIIGALVHNFTQLFIVSTILIKNVFVIWLIPVLWAGGLVMGFVSGFLASRVYKELELSKRKKYNAVNKLKLFEPHNQYKKSDSVLHRLSGGFKILVFLVIAIILFTTNNTNIMGALAATAILLVIFSKMPISIILKNIKRISFLVLFCFMGNLFSSFGDVLYSFGFIIITNQGLSAGILVAIRLVLFVTFASIIVYTTSVKAALRIVKKTASPLRHIGMNPEKIAVMINLCLRSIPIIYDEIHKALLGLKKKKGGKRFVYSIAIAIRNTVLIFREFENIGNEQLVAINEDAAMTAKA
ncbi:MAG: Gx transporter family protein [bacterium]